MRTLLVGEIGVREQWQTRNAGQVPYLAGLDTAGCEALAIERGTIPAPLDLPV